MYLNDVFEQSCHHNIDTIISFLEIKQSLRKPNHGHKLLCYIAFGTTCRFFESTKGSQYLQTKNEKTFSLQNKS